MATSRPPSLAPRSVAMCRPMCCTTRFSVSCSDTPRASMIAIALDRVQLSSLNRPSFSRSKWASLRLDPPLVLKQRDAASLHPNRLGSSFRDVLQVSHLHKVGLCVRHWNAPVSFPFKLQTRLPLSFLLRNAWRCSWQSRCLYSYECPWHSERTR